MKKEEKDIKRAGFNQVTIEDVKLVSLDIHLDDRGYLIEIIRATDPYLQDFGQVYIVSDPVRGTIRAFHKHKKLWDYFFISHGSAKFILVDDREESPTYRSMNFFVISIRNPSLLVVPPGVYHGWVSLEDDTQMISTASEVYNRENPDEIRIPPDSFGDFWKIEHR